LELSLGKNVLLHNEGFSLHRNGYVYQYILFRDIDSLKIRKGPYLRYPFIIFVVGLIMAIFGIGQLYDTPLFDPHTTSAAKLFFILLMLPLSLSIFGIVLLYQSIRRTVILELKVKGKKFWNTIDDVRDEKKRDLLISLVKKKIPENRIEFGPF
jgi:hypothetical protein